jgi:hypothetical protein
VIPLARVGFEGRRKRSIATLRFAWRVRGRLAAPEFLFSRAALAKPGAAPENETNPTKLA